MSVEVRKPKAVASVGDGLVDVQAVEIALSINKPARVDITHHTAKDAAERATECVTADIVSGAASAQAAMFTPNPTGNCSVHVEDGAGGNWSFSGLLTRPQISLIHGTAGMRDTAIHRVGFLSTLKTSIYTYAGLPDEMQGKEGSIKLASVADCDLESLSIAQHLRTVLGTLIAAWQAKPLNEDAVSRELEPKIHGQNAAGLAIWYEILMASIDSTQLPLTASDLAKPMILRSVNQYIAEMYLQPRDDFFDFLRAACAAFQLIYIPGEDANDNGRLVLSSYVLDTSAGQTRTVSPTAIVCDGGPARLVPITQVIGRGVGTNLVKMTPTDSARLQAFPISPGEGAFAEVSLPPWLTYPSAVPLETGTYQYQASGQEAPSLAAAKDKRASVRETLTKLLDEGVSAIVDGWLKNHYIDASLGQATATIVMPMDLTWSVGVRVRIKAAGNAEAGIEDTVLFSAFLTDVSHKLQCGKDAPPPSTTLGFSHVEIGSFSLPNGHG